MLAVRIKLAPKYKFNGECLTLSDNYIQPTVC